MGIAKHSTRLDSEQHPPGGRTTIPKHQLSRWVAFVLVLISCTSLFISLNVSTAIASPQDMTLFDGLDRPNQDSIFLPPPRDMTRTLLSVKKRLQRKEWDDAVAILGQLLAEDSLENQLSTEDYLVANGEGVATSLRWRTQKILGSIPTQHRESYRLRYGTKAKKMLESAIETSDVNSLAEIARKFFFTSAGYEAAMLMGHLNLEEGRPSAAASFFKRVVETDEARKSYEPEVSVMLAMSWLLADDRERAKSVLADLKKTNVGDSIEVLGQSVKVFDQDADSLGWLETLIGSSTLSQNQFVSQWLMFHGNAARTGQSGSGFPLVSPRWIQPTMADQATESIVIEQRDEMVVEGICPAPSVQPLVVGDTVIIRSDTQMIGVDFASGKRKWAYPPETNSKVESTELAELPFRLGSTALLDNREKIKQRMWLDSLYGQAASDGDLIFVVPRPGQAMDRVESRSIRRLTALDPLELRSFNELEAIDVSREGAMAWQVGGQNGYDEPKLAGAFFLGPPLPYEGKLYSVCQQEDLIKLIVLEPKTGKLLWSQQLANNENDRVDFQRDRFRRLAGATPSCFNGTLVCPTGVGALVAIDLSTRELKWGHRYADRGETVNPTQRGHVDPPMQGLWRDSIVVIANGVAMYTPAVIQEEMICVDLQSGKLVSKVDRQGSLFIAGVYREHAILVGASELRGIDIATGKEDWKVDLSEHGVPTGRGYLGDDSYFLPTSKKKMVKINLTEKKITSVVPTGIVLGNVIRYRGDVISHGVDHVATFPQDEVNRILLQQSETRLKTASGNGTAPAQLAHQENFLRGQLLIQSGDLIESAKAIAAAYEQKQLPRYERLLCDVIVQLLEVDFEAGMKFATRYEDAMIRRRGDEYLVAKTTGLSLKGDYRQSIDLLIKHIKENALVGEDKDLSQRWVTIKAKTIDTAESDSSGEDLIRYRLDRWLATQTGRLHKQLAEKNLSEANQAAIQLTELVTELNSKDPLKQYARCQLLPLNVIAPAVRMKVANTLELNRHYLRATHLLSSVIDESNNSGSDDEQLASLTASAQARLQLTELMIGVGDFEYASLILDQFEDQLHEAQEFKLGGELAGKGQTLREQVESQLSSRLAILKNGFEYDNDEKQAGPIGSDASVKHWQPRILRHEKREQALDWVASKTARIASADHPRYGNLFLQFEERNGWLRIGDGFSREFGEYDLRSPQRGSTQKPNNRATEIRVKNHLMMLNKGGDMYCLDWFKVLRGENPRLWRLQMDDRTANSIGSASFQGICCVEDDYLRCRDWLTGELVWERNNVKSRVQLIGSHASVALWFNRESNVFDLESGARLRNFSLDIKLGSIDTVVQDHILFSNPITVFPTEGIDETATNVPDDPFEKRTHDSFKAMRYSFIDMTTGEIGFQKDLPFSSRTKVVESKFGAIQTDGSFELFDLESGNLEAATTLPIKINNKNRLFGLFLDRIGDDILVRCHTKMTGRTKFKRDKVTYSFSAVNVPTTEGPVMLISSKTGKALWKEPASIENFCLVDGQPRFGPMLYFCRRLKSRGALGQIDLQVIVISKLNGALAGSFDFKDIGENNDLSISISPGSLDSQEPEGQTTQSIRIGFQAQEYILTLGDDEELPPLPTAFVTNENSVGEIETKEVATAKAPLPTKDKNRKAFEQAAAQAAERLEQQRKDEATLLEQQMDLKAARRTSEPAVQDTEPKTDNGSG